MNAPAKSAANLLFLMAIRIASTVAMSVILRTVLEVLVDGSNEKYNSCKCSTKSYHKEIHAAGF